MGKATFIIAIRRYEYDAGDSPFTQAELSFSAKFRSSEADRRSAFILPSRFWFFLRHQKEQEKRTEKGIAST